MIVTLVEIALLRVIMLVIRRRRGASVVVRLLLRGVRIRGVITVHVVTVVRLVVRLVVRFLLSYGLSGIVRHIL